MLRAPGTCARKAAGTGVGAVTNNEGKMIKRLADWLEKISVAALVVGLFDTQYIAAGIFISVNALVLSLLLTYMEEKND